MGAQLPQGCLAAIQGNMTAPKDFAWVVPKPVVIVVHLNNHPAWALVDSGSLGDFMLTALVDQLKVKKIELQKPLMFQLAIQGSHSKVNWGVKPEFEYQLIKEPWYFDVVNLSNYDITLGTPWIFRHRVNFGLNLAKVVVGSNKSVLIQWGSVTKIASQAMELLEEILEQARQYLTDYA